MTEIKFRKGDRVVYPSHGVGEVTDVESQTVMGTEIEVYVISLEKDSAILRVPVRRASVIGLRHINSKEIFDEIFVTLQGKPKISKGMWSRRAQEYESKINSGDLLAISEVVRDLHKNVNDPERSYSERVIYEAALERLTSEYAAIEKIANEEAQQEIVGFLKEKEEAA